MFMGAYWSQRQESREQAAERIGRFLRAIAVHGDSFSTWFLQARTKAAVCKPLSCDPRAIAPRLGVNRRDLDRVVMPELGFSLGIWNGEHVPLRMSMLIFIGACHPRISNSVAMSLNPRAPAIDKATWKGLMTDAIEAFEPDHAAHPWETGWLTYERNHEIVEHPWGS